MPNCLNILFGNDWEVFSDNLDIYYETCIKKGKDISISQFIEMENLYKNMVSFYENYGKHKFENRIINASKCLIKKK